MQPHVLAGSPGTTAGKQIMALHLVDQLELLNRQQRDFDTQSAAAVAAHPDGALFTSFPGIGDVIAGVMIGEMGDDRARFPAASALLAESGLGPVTRASGRTRQVRFRYAANKHQDQRKRDAHRAYSPSESLTERCSTWHRTLLKAMPAAHRPGSVGTAA